MKQGVRMGFLLIGVAIGVLVSAWFFSPSRPALAADDRYGDNILCTGPAQLTPGIPTDAIWLLDYKAGKLLASVINRATGKITSWAEVDLVREFQLRPRQDVHFMMTTGVITNGQAALYLAETETGKFGVYTIGPRPDGQAGIVIRRHDMVLYRPQKN